MLKFTICIIMTLVMCSGCAVSGLKGRAYYDVMIRNSTASELSLVSLKFNDYNFGGGWVSSGAEKTYHFSPVPISEKANMSWKDADGNHHAATLEVLKALPPKASWENSFIIVFSFQDENHVIVSYEAELPQTKKMCQPPLP